MNDLLNWFKVVKYLSKHKMWYIDCNWKPSEFLKYSELTEKYKAEFKKEDNYWFKENNRSQDYITNLRKEISRFESEIVHLKDLIQAKNLIIEKLEKQK